MTRHRGGAEERGIAEDVDPDSMLRFRGVPRFRGVKAKLPTTAAWPSACTTAGPVAVIIQRTGQPLASQVRIARTWTARVVGLLATPVLPDGTGLILPRCQSIHTIGMRFPIDAVFVDRSGRIVALKPGLDPGRIIPPVFQAWAVLELPGGTLEHHDVRPGDILAVRASLR